MSIYIITMKYMKKTILLIFIFTLILSKSILANGFKIAAILPNALDERWVSDIKSMQGRAYSLGFDILVFYGDNTLESQKKNISRAVANGIDVIILAVHNPVNSSRFIEMAAVNGIKVVTYLNPPDGPNNVSMYIAFDYTKSGYSQIEYTLKRVPFGTYLFMMGLPTDHMFLDIYAGSVDALKNIGISSNINIIPKAYDPNWQSRHLKKFIENFINEYSDVSVIIIPDDKMAIHIVEAIKEMNLNFDVFVSGQNMTVNSAGYILEGIEIMSTYSDQNLLTVEAVNAAYSIATTGKAKSNDDEHPIMISGVAIPTYYVYPIIIDLNNIQKEIFDKGYINWKDVNELNVPKK